MFKGIAGKLQRWQDAELLSTQQAQDILAFEKQRKAGRLTRHLTFTGFFAIILGLISMVAANWTIIPDQAKLGGHLVLNIGVAWAMLRINPATHPVAKDGLLLLLAGLFLSFIALIGQVFQLHGELNLTFGFWLLICTPFLWYYGRTALVAGPWLLMTLITGFWNLVLYFDQTPDTFWIIGAIIAVYLPIILMTAHLYPWFMQYKSGFAETFLKAGYIIPAFAANIALFLFYDRDRLLLHMPQLALFLGGFILLAIAFHKERNLLAYLLISNLLIILPFTFQSAYALIPALLFIAYWGFLAWLGQRIDSDNLMNWAIRLIILRLFIIYLEVFGNMLFTGIGLVLSGIILLLILRYMNRLVIFGRKLIGHHD